MLRITLFIALSLFTGIAAADCYCTCINGQNQALCDNAFEMKPLCPPRICPIEPPSLRPINPPTLPPLGTETCWQELVWDHNYGEYRWQQVCQ